MTPRSAFIGIALWMVAAYCSGQATSEWKPQEWKKLRSQKLNNCATSITIQRMTTFKNEDIYWVCVSIIAPKKGTKLKYQDIQFTALDEHGAQMESRVSGPLNEKKTVYEDGLATECLGFYHIPFGERKLGTIKMAWNGKEVVFRMSDAMFFPK